jgi:hypothetical protein
VSGLEGPQNVCDLLPEAGVGGLARLGQGRVDGVDAHARGPAERAGPVGRELIGHHSQLIREVRLHPVLGRMVDELVAAYRTDREVSAGVARARRQPHRSRHAAAGRELRTGRGDRGRAAPAPLNASRAAAEVSAFGGRRSVAAHSLSTDLPEAVPSTVGRRTATAPSQEARFRADTDAQSSTANAFVADVRSGPTGSDRADVARRRTSVVLSSVPVRVFSGLRVQVVRCTGRSVSTSRWLA